MAGSGDGGLSGQAIKKLLAGGGGAGTLLLAALGGNQWWDATQAKEQLELRLVVARGVVDVERAEVAECRAEALDSRKRSHARELAYRDECRTSCMAMVDKLAETEVGIATINRLSESNTACIKALEKCVESR